MNIAILINLAAIALQNPVLGSQAITPAPAVVAVGSDSIMLPETITFKAPDNSTLNSYLVSMGLSISSDPLVQFSLTDSLPEISSPEGYRLSISPTGVKVQATTDAGLFYGAQSLLDMIGDNSKKSLPTLTITDQPRFPYRGMMLDISRHFRDKEFIKKQIDAMARLNLNKLHLHLTDAAGWRIEIKKYPELTNFAAWRPQNTWKEWNEGGNKYCDINDPEAHGGYLTQDDIREIVAYAADRHITVIPEIEMPSHSEEVTATYPELSCTHIQYGQPDLCPGNEKTFEFLENVLDEVMELFPSHYIHVGGDEAPKKAWAECDLCKARMENEGLKNVEELQSYLITRMEKYLNSKGRDMLGWDEIMEGGLAPNATVMSWRGTEGGIKAARQGHKVIMSPGAFCYLDGYQDAPFSQPEAIGGYLPLEKVYSYDPAPDSLGVDVTPYIHGIQGNLWCEYIPTAEHAEYMLYPRMIAISEVGWTPQEKRDWNDFRERAIAESDRMKSEGYNVFDIRTEIGNRPVATRPEQHLAKGKPVTYNIPWWKNYPAAGDKTLTDGTRGGWNYNDGLWQGFLYKGDERLDVTIDLEKETTISYIGAEFMQICGPGVWMPENVEISVSNDGKTFRTIKTIRHTQTKSDEVSFKEFEWSGNTSARYVRYKATASNGVLFTDEIIIK